MRPIPSTRFSLDNHITSRAYPFYEGQTPFVKRLEPGWTVVGYAKNTSLAPECQRSEDGGPYNAVMFRDPDGFDCWWHMGDYDYQFVES